MGRNVNWLLLSLTLAVTLLSPQVSQAQSLLSHLPEDETWVRFEGTYTQSEVRPDSATGALKIEPWIEHVYLKSVGRQPISRNGETIACRWLEIQIERGREKDGKIDTGVSGLTVYKVLVAEDAVVPDIDDDGVPVAFIPIIKGYRKIGDGKVTPLDQKVLQLYPLGILVGYYRDVNITEKKVDPEVGVGDVTADVVQGKTTIERQNSQTIQETSVWRSKDVPFGIARWSAKITRYTKDNFDDRSKFKPTTEVIVDMRLREIGKDAQSVLSEN